MGHFALGHFAWLFCPSHFAPIGWVIRPLFLAYLSRRSIGLLTLYTYFFLNNFSFNDKLNKMVKLIPCDTTLRHRAKQRRAKTLATSHSTGASPVLHLYAIPHSPLIQVDKQESYWSKHLSSSGGCN